MEKEEWEKSGDEIGIWNERKYEEARDSKKKERKNEENGEY